MDIECVQEQRLRAQAREEGSYADLVYFLLVQRNLDAITTLRDEAEPLSDDDRWAFLVADLARQEEALPPPPDSLRDVTDIWIYYTLAKRWLRWGRIKEAVATGLAAAQACSRDTTVLNLTAKHCACTGDAELATQLIESSLRLNPTQSDMEALKSCVQNGGTFDGTLYLNVFPRYEEVAFYIPVYNVERYIRRAIEGLLSLNYPLKEIIVVDDGSPDQSAAIATEYPVRILHHEANLGLAAARNTAFRAASAALVGAIDSDAEPEAKYVKYAMIEFENAPQRLAGVGGRLCERYTDTPSDLWRAVHLGQDPGPWRQYQPRFLYGSNAIFRREAVEAVGGFQACHRTNYEDVRLSFDLVARGYELCHTPWAKAFHLRRDTLLSILKTKWNWLYWNRVQGTVFENPERLIDQIDATMAESLGLITADIDAGRRELIYIDYLWPFVDTLLSLAYAMEIRAFPKAHGVYVQGRVISAAHRLGTALDISIGSDVENDIAPLLSKGDASIAPPQERWIGPLEATLEAFHDACMTLGASVFEHAEMPAHGGDAAEMESRD